jgi:hypothetical protein
MVQGSNPCAGTTDFEYGRFSLAHPLVWRRLACVAHAERIMYVELKSGNDRGLAWIGRVRFSKTGRTVYYRGRTLRRSQGIAGNHVDVVSGEEFWISGIKADGNDRHWAGGGPVDIDPDVRDEYVLMVSPLVRRKLAKGSR